MGVVQSGRTMDKVIGEFMWKIQKIVSKGDYTYAVVPEHPNATRHGYVLTHRIVIENHIGRLLNKSEIVHHKNGNKKDNRISNLEIMAVSEHERMHALQRGKTVVDFVCPQCKKRFTRLKRCSLSKYAYRTDKLFFCSKSCSSHWQFSDATIDELNTAISENISRIYKNNFE